MICVWLQPKGHKVFTERHIWWSLFMPLNESNYKWTGKEIERFPKIVEIIHSLQKMFHIKLTHVCRLTVSEFRRISMSIPSWRKQINWVSVSSVHASHSQLLHGGLRRFWRMQEEGMWTLETRQDLSKECDFYDSFIQSYVFYLLVCS